MNTRNKRASALGVLLASLVVLPAPDSSIIQADRQHVDMSYAGILAGALVVIDATADVTIIVSERPQTIVVPPERDVVVT